ncbi:hypothetical protein OHT76_41195 [Streptomyces sp. NBC_00287]|uniref:hypothetical protein n=1 Tax=Streptomyces sp. NBC_00287 TaxID=2975702 RepID=UPI002E2B9491|nr:hypothetical protein [Streptomyces sp. NBC_00287]
MAHRPRPRVHLVTGGPAWEERHAVPRQAGFTRSQQAARKQLTQLMGQLEEAIRRRDWQAARTARSAAWDEVNRLADYLTREERTKLWTYKRLILNGEAQDRPRTNHP